VLTFFIAGLLYLLRFERVDNLGAYSIPSETGLLIPSGFVNNRKLAVLERRFVPQKTSTSNVHVLGFAIAKGPIFPGCFDKAYHEVLRR
jgi:hypothetical protein